MAICHIRMAFTALLALTSYAAKAETARVAIENFAFDPPSLTVKAGTKIEFTNRDPVPHSVVGFREGREEFRSNERIETEESFVVLADKSGVIDINCGLHARITGKIIVTP